MISVATKASRNTKELTSHSENAPRAKRHLDNYGSEWSNIWPCSYLGVPEWLENAIGSILFMALAKKKAPKTGFGGLLKIVSKLTIFRILRSGFAASDQMLLGGI